MKLPEQLLQFSGIGNLPKNISELDTSNEYFHIFFFDRLLDKVVEESNSYAIYKNPEKPLNLTRNYIKQIIGITICMSLVQLPNTGYEK